MGRLGVTEDIRGLAILLALDAAIVYFDLPE